MGELVAFYSIIEAFHLIQCIVFDLILHLALFSLCSCCFSLINLNPFSLINLKPFFLKKFKVRFCLVLMLHSMHIKDYFCPCSC